MSVTIVRVAVTVAVPLAMIMAVTMFMRPVARRVGLTSLRRNGV